MKYLVYSDISLRVALNPRFWLWVPKWNRDAPTPLFPNRNTFFVGWLFLQLFIDVDNGKMDFEAYTQTIMNHPAMLGNLDYEDELDEPVSKSRKRSRIVE